MSILEYINDNKVKDVVVTDVDLIVELNDGRRVCVPLVWYPRLSNATTEQRNNWQVIGSGFGIHWPEVDEDLSVEGLLLGTPAPGVKKNVKIKK